MMSDEELAGRYFDAEQAPGLRADGMPDDGIAANRAQFIVDISRAAEEIIGYSRGPYVTKSGRVLTDDDIDKLVEEAEGGE